MADRRQHRRTLSINGAVYARLQAICRARGLSISGLVERFVAELPDGVTAAPVPNRWWKKGRAA